MWWQQLVDLVAALEAGVLLRWNDVDDAASATGSELNRTSGEREQGVVAAASDVTAGVEVGAALANDDLAGVDDLAAKALHTKTL